MISLDIYIYSIDIYIYSNIYIAISYTCNACIQEDPPTIAGADVIHKVLRLHKQSLSSCCCFARATKQALI